MRASTFVLMHGSFHGGWCWKEVAAILRAGGHEVFLPTLTGLGERSHLVTSGPTLETFIEDVAQVIRYEDLSGVVLVGHSFSGSMVSAIADRMPERLKHLVYLDAGLLRSGQASVDIVPPEVIERYKARAYTDNGCWLLPPSDPALFGITDPARAKWLAAKMSPHPFQTYFDKLHLRNPLGNGIPATYIACSQPFFANTATSRELARTLPGWNYVEIATAHDAMITAPARLAEMLCETI